MAVRLTHIDVEDIDRQRDVGWVDFHPEDYCHNCGTRNIQSWSTDNIEWNLVTSSHFSESGPEIILCPQCYVEIWEEETGLKCTWELSVVQKTVRDAD